jgi:hypothetical protein
MDNAISLLLKKAREYRVPVKYVTEDRNLFTEINNLLPTEISLNSLYIQFPTILPEDLVLIYAISEMRQIAPNEILQNINNFYGSIGNINTIRDVAELTLLAQEFRNNLQIEFERDMERLDKIEILQEELSQYEVLPYSPIRVESVIFFANMKWKTIKHSADSPNIEDGYEIFDSAIPNEMLPFLKWNTNSNELFKLFKGKTLEDRPNYNNIIPTFGTKREGNNTFSFSVWDGDLEKDNIRETTKESFLKGLYSLETNLLRIKIPIDKGKEKILNRITNVFPLTFANTYESSISGELYIFGIEVNDLLLSHMILNYELLNNYLFMKEMSSSFVDKKKQMKIYFRSTNSSVETEIPSSVAFSINQNYANGGEEISLSNGSTLKLNPNDPYIGIKISSATSLVVAQSFIEIFSRLLSYYKDKKNELEQLYISYIPNFLSEKKFSISSRKITKENDTKISRLKQVAPDLFITDYARKCLCQFQPIAIENDEVEAWKNKTFVSKGKRYNRQVLTFPPSGANRPGAPKVLNRSDGPEGPNSWNFVCPEDSYPFPGVKKNTLANKNLYAGLPCCFVNDQMSETANSKYNQIYKRRNERRNERLDEQEDEEENDGHAEQAEQEENDEQGEPSQNEEVESHMIKTDKILRANRYGSLPSSIVNLLNNVLIKDNTKKTKNSVLRRGVPRSVNSLLHCISVAAKDPQYLEKNDEEKERYVINLRKAIARKTFPGLLKQEMYDFSDFEISNSLREGFLDPDLYFRAIEEAYNINIFVFAPSEDEEKRLKNKEESIGILQLSRFKLFPVRSPKPDRSTVCIYRTLGSESDNLTYPQCELIVSYNEKEETSLFGKEIYDLLFSTMLAVSRTISWELVENNTKNIDIIARDNVYSQVNYYTLTGRIATAQYVDEYGKLRGLYLPVGGREILMIVPPSQPENLPVSKEIIKAPVSIVLSFLSNPVAASLISKENTDTNANGLWFSVLDLIYGIYVPTTDFIKGNLPIGPSNPLGPIVSEFLPIVKDVKSNAVIEVAPRIRKLKRDLDFLLQIIKWLYSLSNLSLEEFLNNYIGIGNVVGDSSKIYDFSNIGRIFPNVKTVEEGIVEMSKRVPSLFVGSRLFLYSEKLFNGIYYIISMFLKEYVKGKMTIPKMIVRKQLTEQDFLAYSGVALFMSENDLRTWLSSLNKYPSIYENINETFSIRQEPFLYIAPDKHIYLIQNVVEGDILRALNIALYWDIYKVNPGFRSPEYENEIENASYLIYGISPASTIVPIEDHVKKGSPTFLTILQYNSLSYAAMLRLL